MVHVYADINRNTNRNMELSK